MSKALASIGGRSTVPALGRRRLLKSAGSPGRCRGSGMCSLRARCRSMRALQILVGCESDLPGGSLWDLRAPNWVERYALQSCNAIDLNSPAVLAGLAKSQINALIAQQRVRTRFERQHAVVAHARR